MCMELVIYGLKKFVENAFIVACSISGTINYLLSFGSRRIKGSAIKGIIDINRNVLKSPIVSPR